MKSGNMMGSPVLPEMPAGTDYSQVPNYFYMCPGAPLPVKGRSWGNYSVHPVIMRGDTNIGPHYRLSKILRPSQVILIADGSQNDLGDDSFFSTYGAASDGAGGYFNRSHEGAAGKSLSEPLDRNNPNRDSRATIGFLRYRHNNNVNCLFVDGHVSPMTRGSLTFGNVIDDR